MPVVVHEARREVFNGDQVILANQPSTDLVQIISPLVGNLCVQAGNLAVGFSLTVAALGLSRGMTLQAAKFCQALAQPARIFDQLACLERGKAFQA
jgi:hypothetical protein